MYDLDGGTFDATVLQFSAEGLYVLATDGSNKIGGKGIDELIMASGKPRENIVCKQPHQAVAYGAALIADQRNTASAKTLQCISAYDLGVRARNPETAEPMVQVLVKKNMPVPAAESTTFYTTREDQPRMVIEVIQQKTEGQQEKSLGYFIFGIDAPRKNYPIEITLAYDLEGMVKVTAKDPETGKVLEQIMDEQGQSVNTDLLKQKSKVVGCTTEYK